MKCINRNHPDFQRLLKRTELPPLLAEAKVSLWMRKNKVERFPSNIEFDALMATKNDPIRALGMKYNMNTSGYMPKNVDLAQIQRDARKYGLTVVKARSGNWYLKDGNRMINPFKQYQLEETGPSELPIKELNDRLFKWAETHGIKIEAMEEMLDRFSNNEDLYSGAVGLTDFLNKIIVLNQDKENITTLAEEVAHFATGILAESTSVKKAMEKVTETEVYERVKEKYKDVYTREEDFQKEAVDKLLAEAIVEKFKETSNNKGILAYLKGIFSKFQKWISGVNKTAKDEIKDILSPLANSILNGDYLGDIDSIPTDQPIFRQLEETEEESEEDKEPELSPTERRKQKFLEDSISILKTRKKGLLTKKPESGKKVLEVINAQILQLDKALRVLQLDEGLNGFIDMINKEYDIIEEILVNSREKGKIKPTTSTLIRQFTEMYRSHLNDLRTSLDYFGFPKDEIEKYTEVLDEIGTRLNKADNDNNSLSRAIPIEMGLSEDMYEDSQTDLSWWRFYLGNLKYATSDIVKKSLKILKDSVMTTKRHTVQIANDLLQAQTLLEAAGYKVEDIISSSKDEKGKTIYSHYFVDKYDWKYYYEKKKEAYQDIATTLGYDAYEHIDRDSLSEKDNKTIQNALNIFDKKYSKSVFNISTNTYDTFPKKKNPQYDKLTNKNHPEYHPALENYYLKVLQYNKAAVNKLPKRYRTEAAYRMLPAVRKQFIERFFQSNNSFLTNIQESAKESFTVDEDDTQFGDLNALNNKMVPIYFTHKLDVKNLSLDITRSVSVFSEMAENFQQMNKIAGQMETLLYWTKQRKYLKGKHKVDGDQSYEYKALNLLLDVHLYGIKKENRTVTIGGKKISITKLNQRFAKYISTNNLALNVVTSTAGAIKGNIDSTIEDQLGLYTTTESKNFARTEFPKQSLHAAKDMFKKKQTSKIQLLLQLTNIVDVTKMVKSSNSNALAREIVDRNLLFANYRLADFGLKGRSMIAIMDNHRLYNGNFISKYNFIKAKEVEGLEYHHPTTNKKGAGKDAKTINKAWKELQDQSLYNAYEVVDNQLQVKEEFKDAVTDEVLNRVTGIIDHVTHRIDGTLSETDKGQLARSAYGDFVLMHRGWFVTMIDSRFMKETKLEQTGEKEIGAYRAFGQYAWKELIVNKKFLAFGSAYRGLEPHQQRGVKLAILDLIYMNIIAFLAALANIAADDADEDDWTTQYFAFQMNRLLLEQKSGNPIAFPGELLQLIDEPVVGVTTLKDLVNIADAWSPEEYESGIYEGKSHASKWWWKRLPFKNITELQHPELKNRYIKQIVDSRTYNMMVEDEDKLRNMTYKDRLSTFFTYQEDVLDNQEILDRIDTFEEFEEGNLP